MVFDVVGFMAREVSLASGLGGTSHLDAVRGRGAVVEDIFGTPPAAEPERVKTNEK
ncbi:hypothetical protein [Actinoallomurus iriomotensis]|uniref:hypothetical protein n=1 Tax=Actinoallomurus iriomotensis TaxID=478107 RepID=UPI00255414FC|nr:hypothetical protein [Actinoallomurus iriomotensis]